MGRQRRRVASGGFKMNKKQRIVERRVGNDRLICYDCGKRNSPDAKKCRKCKSHRMRQRKDMRNQ